MLIGIVRIWSQASDNTITKQRIYASRGAKCMSNLHLSPNRITRTSKQIYAPRGMSTGILSDTQVADDLVRLSFISRKLDVNTWEWGSRGRGVEEMDVEEHKKPSFDADWEISLEATEESNGGKVM
ncbi:hypothetical protein PAAG_11796 [Paracoccidioides lutzii Pb01]|uniref:Uncharacterized protein n=1 Tax=Paracoccidioides lutzii (strain ATCC MYA-826 / Pb01) TaxID=502779 RepID=A0A0A2V1R3_PARBA|nr:hypothetical protein PAAG_11796 [Paracoccidioides lutzii Pb01]KGQ01448.1 hypothetical protein PAAG_11796 [Paracoccidioides lutzii Pb01]